MSYTVMIRMYYLKCLIGVVAIVPFIIPRWVEAGNNTLTTASGIPIYDLTNILTVGPRGQVLLQDVVFLDEVSHFVRERIPERTVHAKGAGAFGYFEVTHDITKYTKAKLFSEIGKKTSLAVRFSTVSGESGFADSVRDLRGFAIKFYTEEGNYDLLTLNSQVFFIRDPILFPSLIHTQKRNPKSHLKDSNSFWDFNSLRPETTHELIWLFSDRGIPDGFRHMHGFGVSAFKLVNAKNEAVYCKFHLKTNQGIKNMKPNVSQQLAGDDPDSALRDLYYAIEGGNYPSWTFYIQVVTFEQAARNFTFNPFDATKIWPIADYPLIPVGQLKLNRNPDDYFADVEQMAFSPANMPPGIEPSPDKTLQGRLFLYSSAQRHRLGTNHLQIPVNCPLNGHVKNYQRDGGYVYNKNQAGSPNYFPNSFEGPMPDLSVRTLPIPVSGDIDRYDTDDHDFEQAGNYYRSLGRKEQNRVVNNLANNLLPVLDKIQKRAVHNFAQADAGLGKKLAEKMAELKAPYVRKPEPVTP